MEPNLGTSQGRVTLTVILGLSPKESKIQNDVPQLHVEMVKGGKGRNGVPRFKYQQCGKRSQKRKERPFADESRIAEETICRILLWPVEGSSACGTAHLATLKNGRC